MPQGAINVIAFKIVWELHKLLRKRKMQTPNVANGPEQNSQSTEKSQHKAGFQQSGGKLIQASASRS
ncbi:hypothetical protein ACLK1Y_16335 [Escherichia coli]